MRRVSRVPHAPALADSLAARLRPWALPVLTLVIAFWLFAGSGFDREALAQDFQAGRPEAALDRLATTRPADLPAMIAGVNWWPKSARAKALSDLATQPADERLESRTEPTLAAPLDNLLQAPTHVRLREARPEPLRFTLRNVDLNLEAESFVVPAGSAEFPLHAPLLPGGNYLMTLAEPESGATVALAGFRWVAPAAAQDVTLALGTAHDLAGASHEGSSLLTAIVALQRGFTDDAITRLVPLELRPGYERLALELHALALARQGLDETARRLLLTR